MKPKAWLLLLIAVAAGVAWWHFKPSGEAGKGKKPPPPVPVTVALAVGRDMPVTVDAVGRGEAYETVTLKSRVDGQVLEVPFAEGKPVAAGAVLVRLDPADFQARMKQAEANLARDRAQLNKAQADVARYQALLEQNFVSREKVADLRAIVEAAAAVLQADQAALDLARLQLAYTRIQAPFAGVMGSKRVFPGAALKANETELAVINRVRPLYVSFSMPERHLPAIQAARARGSLTVAVSVPGDKRQVYSGKVVFLDNAVDAATGTLRMKAELPNQRDELAPGQFLDVSLYLDTLRNAVVVPAEAVQEGPEGSFVYVLKRDAGAEIRKVDIVLVRDGQAAIGKGLASGETVITDGHLRLTPGSTVKVKTPGAAKKVGSPG